MRVKKSSSCSKREEIAPPSTTRAAPPVSAEYFVPQRKMRIEAHGVTTKAMPSEKNIATPAPSGVGLMYGPDKPPTKAIGSTAAITAKVARMVALPTSFTASTAIDDPLRP